MYRRNILANLRASLADTPVTLLCGARQTGKTTLIRSEGYLASKVNYVTLDDFDALSAADSDPTGFIGGLARAGEPVVIDEVQRAPGLLVAIKASVDRDRRPGRFLLTGSANVLLLPKLSESLVGRMEVLTLWPLSQMEAEGGSRSFVDQLFENESPINQFPETPPFDRADLVRRVATGGYPEAIARSESRRTNWFDSYLTTLLQRDVRDLSKLDGLTQLPLLLKMIAARTASLLNISDISRTANIPNSSLSRYLSLLEMTYLIRMIPAWSGNFSTRLVKSPKIILNDAGLATYLLGVSEARILKEPQLLGALLENFVAMEILKDIGWCGTKPALHHWRTAQGEKVDFLLETRDGRLAGIEVKASSSVTSSDFKGLRALEAMAGDNFIRGVMLYAGERVVPFGDKLFAIPLSALWRK